MRLQHRCLLMSGFTILSIIVALGSASAQSSTRSSAATEDRPHGIQLLDRQPRYDYYNYPATVPVSPGCYLPSDGCLSEYSVQN